MRADLTDIGRSQRKPSHPHYCSYHMSLASTRTGPPDHFECRPYHR